MSKDFLHSLKHGAKLTGIFGIASPAIAGGIAAVAVGPVSIVAAVGMGLGGLLGGAISAVDASTRVGDYKGSWVSSIPLSLLMAVATYFTLESKALPSQESIQDGKPSTSFNETFYTSAKNDFVIACNKSEISKVQKISQPKISKVAC